MFKSKYAVSGSGFCNQPSIGVEYADAGIVDIKLQAEQGAVP
ncbi:MAG: hypothetical protein RIC19_15605 [Phaeodactylibacter sp.]